MLSTNKTVWKFPLTFLLSDWFLRVLVYSGINQVFQHLKTKSSDWCNSGNIIHYADWTQGTYSKSPAGVMWYVIPCVGLWSIVINVSENFLCCHQDTLTILSNFLMHEKLWSVFDNYIHNHETNDHTKWHGNILVYVCLPP